MEEPKAVKLLGWHEVIRLQDLGLGGKLLRIPKKRWHLTSPEFIKNNYKIERQKGKKPEVIFKEMANFTGLSVNWIRKLVYRK